MESKYLFLKKQRILILFSGLLIMFVRVLPHPFIISTWQTSVNAFFLPYSSMIFILILTIWLCFLKRENWKNKIRIITLLATIIYIIFNTYLEINYYFSIFINNPNNSVLAPMFNSMGMYRISEVFFLDLFAFFTFFAINYTLNKLKD